LKNDIKKVIHQSDEAETAKPILFKKQRKMRGASNYPSPDACILKE